MNGGGPIPWNAFAFCETSKTSWVMGKHHVEDDFGESFKGLIIPFGSLIEYHPISPKYQTRFHQFGKKVLQGIFFGCALIAGEFGKEMFWWQTWKIWKSLTHQMFILEESTRRRS